MEQRVSAVLQAKGIETYLPTMPVYKGRLIKSGPLRNLEAVFDRSLSSSDRARVLVDVSGRLTACEMELDCLEKVTRKQSGHWVD